jgi:hypothetical protein
MTRLPNPCADLVDLDDLAEWAADLPTDEDGEHVYVVITQLVRYLLDDCAEAAP